MDFFKIVVICCFAKRVGNASKHVVIFSHIFYSFAVRNVQSTSLLVSLVAIHTLQNDENKTALHYFDDKTLVKISFAKLADSSLAILKNCIRARWPFIECESVGRCVLHYATVLLVYTMQ